MLQRNVQVSSRTIVTALSIGDVVDRNIVDNETLGYFMARIELFLLQLGYNTSKIRYRQHLETEMAHYATDW
jgi:glycyl-tRNA synthetase